MKRFLFALILLAWPGGAWGAGVKYVEHATVNIANSESVGATALTHSQTASKCVPFFSYWQATSYSPIDSFKHNAVLVRVIDTLSGTYAVASRTGDTNAIEAEVYVVEFESSVDVQTGLASSVSGTGTNIDITDVDTTKAFALCSYTCDAATSDDYANGAVRAYFRDNGDSLRLERDGSAGTFTAQWYVVEDTYSNWTVQSGTFSIPASTATGNHKMASSVTMAKTFLVASWESSLADDNDSSAIPQITLFSVDTVRAVRYATAATDTVTVSYFAVSFAAGGNEAVYRGVVELDGAVIYDTISIGATLVDTISMVYTVSQRPAQTNSPYGGSNNSCRTARVVFKSSLDSLIIRNSGSTAQDNRMTSWEAVKWEAGLGTSGGGQPLSVGGNVVIGGNVVVGGK